MIILGYTISEANVLVLLSGRSKISSFFPSPGNFNKEVISLRHLFPLQVAFAWACTQRADYSHNADIWSVRWRWNRIQKTLASRLSSGRYLFSPLKQLRFADGSIKDIWGALDAIVLKSMTLRLTPLITRFFSKTLRHLKGQGGTKRALREVKHHLPKYKYVMRSDVKGYYASMCHQTLYEQVQRVVKDGRILALVWQFMKRTVEYGGIFWTVHRGISLGCPLSPLMAALYLRPLDEAMEELDVFYVRYMDDWVILAKTRWQLKRAVKIVNEVLNDLKVEKHPDKTFIGPIKKGFCFLGYLFDKRGLRVSPQTKQRAVENAKRLSERCGTKDPVVEYLRRFNTWAKSGLDGCVTETVVDIQDIQESCCGITLEGAPAGAPSTEFRSNDRVSPYRLSHCTTTQWPK